MYIAPIVMGVSDDGPIGAGHKLLRIRLGTQRITRKEIDEVKCILSDVKQNVEEILARIPAEELSEGLKPAPCDSGGHPTSGDNDMSMAATPTLENLNPSARFLKNKLDGQYHKRCLVAFHRWAREFLSLIVEKVS